MNEKDINQTADAALQDEGSMPPGFQQTPHNPTRRELVEHYAIMYGLSVLGFVLAPVAFALRLGRWSMRTLWCHHAGHEFGDF